MLLNIPTIKAKSISARDLISYLVLISEAISYPEFIGRSVQLPKRKHPHTSAIISSCNYLSFTEGVYAY